MKKIFLLILAVFSLFTLVGCEKKVVHADVIRIGIFCEESKRDDIIERTTALLKGADSEKECKERLLGAGYTYKETYFGYSKCGGRIFPAGYYPTFYIGEGTKGWQYIAYPSYVYQSLEEFDNAGYSSFFYEIIKKMEDEE